MAILVGKKPSDDLTRTLKVRGGANFKIRTYTHSSGYGTALQVLPRCTELATGPASGGTRVTLDQCVRYLPAVMALKTSGAGDPLVLLHGVNTTHAIWTRVRSRLASTRLVVTPDLPGFGESAPVRRGFDLDQVADALAEELSGVAAPFDLLGHSLGGAVALILAHRQRDLVRRLVLAAPAGFSPKTSLVAKGQGHLYAAGVDIRDVVARPMVRTALGRRLLFGKVVADASALKVEDARLILEASRGGTRVREAVIAVQSADLRPLLAKLHIPLGFLWGERDSLVGFNILEELRSIAPSAQIETIENAGHVPQIERPAAFVAGVEALLARL